jgi:hypothetical protein
MEEIFPQEEECWSIAESMIEEIEQIKGKKNGNPSQSSMPKGNLKKLLMKRVRMAKALRAIGH